MDKQATCGPKHRLQMLFSHTASFFEDMYMSALHQMSVEHHMSKVMLGGCPRSLFIINRQSREMLMRGRTREKA